MIYLDEDEYIGGCDDFAKWALYNHAHEVKDTKAENEASAKQCYANAINNCRKSKFAFMNITSEGLTA